MATTPLRGPHSTATISSSTASTQSSRNRTNLTLDTSVTLERRATENEKASVPRPRTASLARRAAFSDVPWEVKTQIASEVSAAPTQGAAALFPHDLQLLAALDYGSPDPSAPPGAGTVNFNPVARKQIEMLLHKEPLSPEEANLLTRAAVQLTAPAHIELRLDIVDKLASSSGLTPANLQKLMTAASRHDPSARLNHDDGIRLPFALKVGKLVEAHLAGFPADAKGSANRFLQELNGFSIGMAKLSAQALLGGRHARESSQWSGKGPKDWHSIDARFAKPMEIAVKQPKFPLFDAYVAVRDVVAAARYRAGGGLDMDAMIASRKIDVALVGAIADRLDALVAMPEHAAWDRVADQSGDLFRPTGVWWRAIENKLPSLVAGFSGHADRQAKLTEQLDKLAGTGAYLLDPREVTQQKPGAERLLDHIAQAMGSGKFSCTHRPLLRHVIGHLLHKTQASSEQRREWRPLLVKVVAENTNGDRQSIGDLGLDRAATAELMQLVAEGDKAGPTKKSKPSIFKRAFSKAKASAKDIGTPR